MIVIEIDADQVGAAKVCRRNIDISFADMI